MTPDEFRHAFRHHPAGVAVVTADVGDGPVAMTVSSLASVELNPPALVFSASGRSSATPTILHAETMVVHLLASDDVWLAKLCAQSGIDRFADDVAWDRLPTGEPYYPAASSWLRCAVVDRVDVHGSTLVVLEAIQACPQVEHLTTVPQPLVYHNRQWHILGGGSVLRETQVPFIEAYGRGELDLDDALNDRRETA